MSEGYPAHVGAPGRVPVLPPNAPRVAGGALGRWVGRTVLRLDIRILGKDTLFRVPLVGALLRRLGVIPVDRSAAHGVVEQAAAVIRAGDKVWYGLAPGG